MIYKLYKVGSTSNSSVSIDVREDDTIEAIVLNVSATTVADGDSVNVEISFLSTSSYDQNDTNGVLLGHRLAFEGAAYQTTQTITVPINKYPIVGGERIYLHVQGSGGTPVPVAQAFIYTSKNGTMRAQRRR